MPAYTGLAINHLDGFLYGVSPRPIRLPNDLSIGAVTVYSELNFTDQQC